MSTPDDARIGLEDATMTVLEDTAVPADVDYPLYDADQHYYEAGRADPPPRLAPSPRRAVGRHRAGARS
jgi:hypothetical protein